MNKNINVSKAEKLKKRLKETDISVEEAKNDLKNTFKYTEEERRIKFQNAVDLSLWNLNVQIEIVNHVNSFVDLHKNVKKPDAYTAFGLTRKTWDTATKLTKAAIQELVKEAKQAFKEGKYLADYIPSKYKAIKIAERHQIIKDKEPQILSYDYKQPIFPENTKFEVLYLDLTELINIKEVEPYIAENCTAFIWLNTFDPFEISRVLSELGMQYKDTLIWDNLSKRNGNYSIGAFDVLIIATKGKHLLNKNIKFASIYREKTKSNRKPDYYTEIIADLFPETACLEVNKQDSKYNPNWVSLNDLSERRNKHGI